MRYRMKIEFVIECANDAEAAAATKKAEAQLRNPMTALYLAGQGLKLCGVRVDPKPTRE